MPLSKKIKALSKSELGLAEKAGLYQQTVTIVCVISQVCGWQFKIRRAITNANH